MYCAPSITPVGTLGELTKSVGQDDGNHMSIVSMKSN